MREFKKRRTEGAEVVRVLVGTLGVMVLCVVAFGASRAAWDMYGKFASAAAARAGAEAQLEELQAREAKVKADVEAFASERGVEAQLRERYGVARPGEGQIDIVREASSTEILRREKGMWETLWDLLFVW